MQVHWGWTLLAALALCAGLIWWTQPAVVARILHSEPGRHVPAHQVRRVGDAGPTLYRWVDAGGVVNITSTRPPAGRRYAIVHIDPNQNIVPMSAVDSAQKAPKKPR